MKRHIVKDVIIASPPLTLFFSYALPARGLLLASKATYNMLPAFLFNLISRDQWGVRRDAPGVARELYQGQEKEVG